MNGGLYGPGLNGRSLPDGRRTRAGTRTESANDDATNPRAVLSIVVKSNPYVLAEVTGLAVRRWIPIERLVAEQMDNSVHSQKTFVVDHSHPGIERVSGLLEGLYPVMAVEERDIDSANRLTSSKEEVWRQSPPNVSSPIRHETRWGRTICASITQSVDIAHNACSEPLFPRATGMN